MNELFSLAEFTLIDLIILEIHKNFSYTLKDRDLDSLLIYLQDQRLHNHLRNVIEDKISTMIDNNNALKLLLFFVKKDSTPNDYPKIFNAIQNNLNQYVNEIHEYYLIKCFKL